MVLVPGRLWQAAARAAVGPLAFVAFFSDWVEGSGALAGHAFSGFDLVAFTGRLQTLDLAPWESALLWAVRLGVLGVAIAAAWQCVLAPGLLRHPAYAVSGWYLAIAAVLVMIIGVARDGLALPPGGPLLALAAGAFVLASRTTSSAGAAPLPR